MGFFDKIKQGLAKTKKAMAALSGLMGENGGKYTAEAEKLGLAAGTKGATGADYVPLADDGVGKEGDNIAPILEADKKAEDEANNAAGENNDSADGNNNTDGNTSKKGLSGGIIALLVVAGLAIVAGAVYLFVIKPKRIARFSKDTTEE